MGFSGDEDDNRRMEGWLYLLGSNRLGLQSSRKRYFILEANCLNCYKGAPTSKKEDPIRSVLIDSCIRVTDNGRESFHRNVFFIFTLHNVSNHEDQLKLGARTPDEAATWTRILMEASMKESPSRADILVASSKMNGRLFRSRNKGRNRMHSIDWTDFPSIRMIPTSSDVISPSSWTIIGCSNGLRMFEEVKDDEPLEKGDDQLAIMAVGVVDASSESIFETVMSFGPSRSEWDFCLLAGTVVEQLDAHTDIIHKKLRGDWMPWGIKRRDLLLQRYWRREDDGTYVILYHSIFKENIRPESGYIRAFVKSGGYVISPVNQGKQSVVRHMLAVDWKLWKSYIFSSSSKYVTIRMLGRVAALRELFRAKLGSYASSDFAGEMTREIWSPQIEKEDIKVELQSTQENDKSDSTDNSRQSSVISIDLDESFLQLNDTVDEFFDVADESEFAQAVDTWSYDGLNSQGEVHSNLSTSALAEKLHNLEAQEDDYIDVHQSSPNVVPCNYGATLSEDPTYDMPCSYTKADPSSFLIRGRSYLQDNHKTKADRTMMQLVGADWLKSDKREDHLARRPGSIPQKYAMEDCTKFFFVVNIQVPGATTYNLALYYMMSTPLEDSPLLESFVKGDEAYRQSRFKLIPYISKGSWIVKQSVGKKACLVGQALEINYFGGKNYLELDIDVGSSAVARGVINLVLSYLNNLVVELAFLVQGNTQEELPEVLIGTCRLNHLDVTKAVPVKE